MSKEIETQVAEYIKSIGVKFSVTGGFPLNKDGWECDHWLTTFTIEGKTEQAFDYHTGVGHRRFKTPMPAYIAKLGKNIIARVEWEKHHLKPVAPSAASVLYCLLIDASSAEQNFEDWCSDFGADSDSIKSLNTYRACCDTLNKMRKLFSNGQRNHLQELLEDF